MQSRKPIRIRFVGDISFNDGYIEELEKGNNPFAAIEPLLKDTDLAVGNLECLAKGSAQNENKVPRIHTSVQALDALKQLNFGLVSLATNHVYDNLKEGFELSVNKLDELGINYLGASVEESKAATPYIFESKGWKIGFLNFVHEDTNPKIPQGADVYPNLYRADKIASAIAELKTKVDKVVLLLHWGGKCDYGYFPHQEQVRHAKRFIDAGADAIVGHHTHTFQAHIEYKTAPVYFSLGNFCFDDIRNGDSIWPIRESGRKSGVLELKFEGDSVRHSVLPFRIDGLRLTPEPNLINEFKKWQSRFWWVWNMPGGFSIYYYLLKRWEPVHFHAQLHNTSMLGVAIQKVKRIFGA